MDPPSHNGSPLTSFFFLPSTTYSASTSKASAKKPPSPSSSDTSPRATSPSTSSTTLAQIIRRKPPPALHIPFLSSLGGRFASPQQDSDDPSSLQEADITAREQERIHKPSSQTSPPYQDKPLPRRPSSAIVSPTASKTSPLAVHSKVASLDSPLHPSHHSKSIADSARLSYEFEPRDLDKFPHGATPQPPHAESFEDAVPDLAAGPSEDAEEDYFESQRPGSLKPDYARSQPSFHTAHGSFSDQDQTDAATDEPRDRGDSSLQPQNSNMNLAVDPHQARALEIDTGRPKSPSNLASFFGWKSKQNQVDSPATTFSEGRSVSPMPSPLSLSAPEIEHHAHSHILPVRRSSLRHNRTGKGGSQDSSGSYSDILASPVDMHAVDDGFRVEELLRELREISTELAHSIKREMDLEDELEKARAEMLNSSEQNKRTSDYFSDSGASTMRSMIGDGESKMEAVEKMRRKAEQDKAQMRIQMTDKMQEDLHQRRQLEAQIKALEDQLQTHDFQSEESSERERQLAASIDDYKRRLNDEKSHKGNFEDILAGMRQELQTLRNERDNLKDEVVPRHEARIQGLELEAAKVQVLQYENSKMAKELEDAEKNAAAAPGSRRLPHDGASDVNGYDGSAADRYKDIAPESLPERLKDSEEQRDALQRTLKMLVLRQARLMKRHEKQVRTLETERDNALSATPRRAAFAVEVHSLRGEVNYLRQRANEALEQKWQCEKGLGGIKMDLDRAQQETASLRDLLRQQDMFSSASSDDGSGAEEASLDAALSQITAMQRSGQQNAKLETLAAQVKTQLALNKDIREKMTRAITRGESEQNDNTKKIVALEAALRAAEDKLMTAQSHSEDSIAKQEEHVRLVKDANTDQTLRGVTAPLKLAVPTDTRSPRSPSSPFGKRSPKLDITKAGKGMNVQEAVKTPILQSRVRELEEAAAKADREMESVVEAMNRAQIEVASLQTQRDEAQRQTRRLQREVAALTK